MLVLIKQATSTKPFIVDDMNAVIAVIEKIGRLTNGEPLRLITMAKLV